MTDPLGRPPTWFLFHVDRETSSVLYARSRTIWCCRYVRAFGSHSRIEGTSRIEASLCRVGVGGRVEAARWRPGVGSLSGPGVTDPKWCALAFVESVDWTLMLLS